MHPRPFAPIDRSAYRPPRFGPIRLLFDLDLLYRFERSHAPHVRNRSRLFRRGQNPRSHPAQEGHARTGKGVGFHRSVHPDPLPFKVLHQGRHGDLETARPTDGKNDHKVGAGELRITRRYLRVRGPGRKPHLGVSAPARFHDELNELLLFPPGPGSANEKLVVVGIRDLHFLPHRNRLPVEFRRVFIVAFDHYAERHSVVVDLPVTEALHGDSTPRREREKEENRSRKQPVGESLPLHSITSVEPVLPSDAAPLRPPRPRSFPAARGPYV